MNDKYIPTRYDAIQGPVRVDSEDVDLTHDHRDDIMCSVEATERWFTPEEQRAVLDVELDTLSALTDEELRKLFDERFESGSQDPTVYPWEMAIVFEMGVRDYKKHVQDLIEKGFLLPQ